jgi:hypothetical protein
MPESETSVHTSCWAPASTFSGSSSLCLIDSAFQAKNGARLL